MHLVSKQSQWRSTGGAAPGNKALEAYHPELDGLRAVAIISVILFHAEPSGVFSGGFIGVDIFFVLSAYLITGILVRELRGTGRIRLGVFYLKRAIRLVPALLLMLVAYVFVAPIVWPETNHLRDALIAALYLTDYSFPIWHVPNYLRHTWSLAVEEHFYLIWPLLLPLLLASKRPVRWLLVAYALGTIWRVAWASDWVSAYYRFDTHFTGLALGALLFFYLPKLSLRPAHAIGACAILAIQSVIGQIDNAWMSIPAAELAAALLVGCLVTGQAGVVGTVLAAEPMKAIGRLSYAMYLWHSPVAYAIREDWGFASTFAVILICALLASIFSYFTVEALGRSLKSKIRAAPL